LTKKKKLSVLSDNDEAALAKLGKKARSQAVTGKPDQTDVDNLTVLFRTYDHATGGKLTAWIKQNKLERALNNKDATQAPADKAEYLSFFLPEDLQQEVEKYWPTIWSNPEHLRWFLKKFPMFRT
jgi:hypothetical protein